MTHVILYIDSKGSPYVQYKMFFFVEKKIFKVSEAGKSTFNVSKYFKL